MPQSSNRFFSLRQLHYDNRWFFGLFWVFWLALLILAIVVPLGDEILWVNNRRMPFWDVFFTYGTQLGEAPAFLAVIVILLFIRYRYAVAVPLLAITVMLISNGTKVLFGHPRPALFFKNEGLFELLNPLDGIHLNGGANSFPSGHTMAGFALFSFLAFCWPNRRQWVGVVCFLLALIVGFSRIYLLQHFAEDVVLGALIGVMLAMLWYYFANRFPEEQAAWLDRRLFDWRNKS